LRLLAEANPFAPERIALVHERGATSGHSGDFPIATLVRAN
jgi:hypothetical protein